MRRSILDLINRIAGREQEKPVEQPEPAQPVVVHTADCLKAQEAYAAWAKENPFACKECQGRGVLGYEQDRDTGGGDFITCEHCYEEGICPVCSMDLDLERGDGHCDACGWDFDDERTHSPYPECCCYERMLDAQPDTYQIIVEEPPPGAEEYDFALSDFAYEVARERRILGRH